MLTPLLPTTSFAEGGGNSYDSHDTYQYFYSGSEGHLNVANSEQTIITGEEQNMTIHSDNTQIIVNGDYYKETAQFNPKVGEVWSGNAASWNSNALWVPKWSELPSWFTSHLLSKEGYAALYTGFMETDEVWGRKPYGVTRVGEVLGYDIYADGGEDYRYQISGKLATEVTSSYKLLGPNDRVSKDWTLINIYRALGVERYYIGVAGVPKDYTGMHSIVGDRKLTDGKWDLNKSPVVTFLSGNIEANYTGDSVPVLMVWASRTDIDLYRKQAEQDALEYEATAGRSTISRAEFCDWVARLMEAYGEPVITETEQYMLLEAYGRKLPYELYPSQLEACKYLMVRGILDGPNELWSDWNGDITFEEATTILMRVKDKGSRLTFKEFQLTTDLELLKQGYYPVDIALVDPSNIVSAEPLAYETAVNATHYDYFVRRQDNRALFLSDADSVSGVYTEVQPHIASEQSKPKSRLPDSYYRGRTADGWYWFQIPINAAANSDVFFVNTVHSDNDSPAQYILPAGGGYYIVGNGTGGEENVPTVSRASFDEYNANGSYIDRDRFLASTSKDSAKTADADISRDRVTVWLVEVSNEAIKHKVLEGDWQVERPAWINADGTVNTNLAVWNGKDGNKSPMVSACAQGNPLPALDTDGAIGVNIYLAANQGKRYSYFVVESQSQGITLEMARAALDVQKGMDGGLKDSSIARTTRAYCRSNNEYLVSTEYLLAQGTISAFTEIKDNAYYLSVPVDVSKPNVDVYVDMTRNNNTLVVWGSVATFYDKDELLVNHMKDGVYINASLLTGKVNQAHISLPGDQGDGLCLAANTDNLEYYELPNSIGAYGRTLTFGETPKQYMNLTYTNAYGNFIAVRDLRSGGDGRPTLFTLWELPNSVSETLGANKQELAKHDAAKQDFSNYFGNVIGDANTYYRMEDASPEYVVNADGSVPETLSIPRGMYASTSGHVYVEIPDAAEEAWTKGLPFQKGPDGIVNALSNYTTTGEAVQFVYKDKKLQAVVGGASSVVQDNTLSAYYIQPVGLPAMVTGCAVVPVADKDTTYGSLFASSNLCHLYIGPDYLDIGAPSANLPVELDKVYIMHYGGKQLALQIYTGSIKVTSDDVDTTPASPKWESGEAKDITDWLKWLQQAKLKDAEDILTICIIAILQWLPRLFMFIFFVLIGLSMIAAVKPWVIFCDRFFDPYKFLTAGRQTVHTVDVKKMVLCSMIALVLFGFFQNGLILDIIAWCARAVTGIISR